MPALSSPRVSCDGGMRGRSSDGPRAKPRARHGVAGDGAKVNNDWAREHCLPDQFLAAGRSNVFKHAIEVDGPADSSGPRSQWRQSRRHSVSPDRR